jgi:hypothetical protein
LEKRQGKTEERERKEGMTGGACQSTRKRKRNGSMLLDCGGVGPVDRLGLLGGFGSRVEGAQKKFHTSSKPKLVC